jgi:two-component system, cell cycle response regulator
MARLRQAAAATGRTLLVIDDNREYLASTRRLLTREGHAVHGVESPIEALELLRSRSVDLVVVDYFMPEMTGAELVRELRAFDPLAQVVLQTGYASEQPPRDLLAELGIQGYFDKNEGPDKLLLWVEVGLRAAVAAQQLERTRVGLTAILASLPPVSDRARRDELMRGLLIQIASVVGATDACVTVDGGVVAGTDRYSPGEHLGAAAELAMSVPLALPGAAVHFDRTITAPRDLEMVAAFARWAAATLAPIG